MKKPNLLTLGRTNPKIAVVTFSNAPVNLITPAFVVEFLDIVKYWKPTRSCMYWCSGAATVTSFSTISI